MRGFIKACSRTVFIFYVLTVVLIPARAAEKTTYIHFDALGSPVAGTDQTGTIVWRESYQPYGERTRKEVGAAANTRWYTGHPEDPETGFVYAGARYYDPAIGRFMAVDPVGFTEKSIHSFGRYSYGNNNPYKYIDPDGAFPIVPVVIWVVTTGWTIHEMTKPVPLDAHGDAGLVTVPTLPGPLGRVGASAKVGKEAPHVLGDLTKSEVKQIQKVVDDAGRPLEVVGSAAKGTRKPTSDIDYLVPPSSRDHFKGLEDKLPGVDPKHGLIPGTHNPNIGPGVRFEPGAQPRLIPQAPQ